MKRIIFSIILVGLPFLLNAQIIADHTIVDDYANIPQQYIDSVKKMWVQVLGLSHSAGYRNGITLLASQEPKYDGFGQEWQNGGVPYPSSFGKLIVSRYYWNSFLNEGNGGWDRLGVDDDDFWLTTGAVENIKKNIIYCNGAGNIPVRAVAFGWCWDVTLISDSNNFNTYLNSIIEIGKADVKTTAFFTTGPVDVNGDGTQENSQVFYKRYLSYEKLREYVNQNGGILFDYADILSYNDAGEPKTASWEGKTYQIIHPDNDGEYNSSHIGETGCIRLAKAMWWMLARLAGWDEPSAGTLTNQTVKYKIYPVPAKDFITIDCPYTIKSIKLLNLSGQIVNSTTGNANNISISDLAKGVYLLKAETNEAIILDKIMIE